MDIKMDTLPELVLEHIFSFLDNQICCKNINGLSIMMTNKYLRHFYKSHFKYYIYEFIDLKKYEKIFQVSGKHAPKNLRFCTRQCNYLNKNELDNLANVLSNFTRLKEYGRLDKKKRNKFSNYTNEKTCSNIYVHFDTALELENFKIKMGLLDSNIWFNTNCCCEGKGCDIEIYKR
tara:strand:+ start:2083 stop:2610 length:528 start_codon:yes stop_codon:yes gene_type:complete